MAATNSFHAIEKNQIQQIKILSKALDQSHDDYTKMLLDNYKVSSCLDLSRDQAAELIRGLRQTEGQRSAAVIQEAHQGKKYDNLQGRMNYLASPAQLRLVEVLWSHVSRALPGEPQQKALNHFLSRYGVKSLLWMPKAKVRTVVNAIEAMRATKFEKERTAVVS